jgi:hypothetical protein
MRFLVNSAANDILFLIFYSGISYKKHQVFETSPHFIAAVLSETDP